MKKESANPEIIRTDASPSPENNEDLYCELDPTKICDNCFRCLESEADYATVEIDGIYMNGERIY